MHTGFLCVGTVKGGTTTLHDILKQHPDISLPCPKETYFFVRKELYDQGLDFYQQKYFKHLGQRVMGEIGPTYMYFDYVPRRIYESFGRDIKLIFLLRDPVDRAYSHYLMNRRNGDETETFERTIEIEKVGLQNSSEVEVFRYNYVSAGMYVGQIKRFLEYFPYENLKFIIFEEFIQDQDRYLREICDFLKIRYVSGINTDIQSNSARELRSKVLQDLFSVRLFKTVGKFIFPTERSRDWFRSKVYTKSAPINPKTKEFLISVFHEEVVELEKLIGKDLSMWLK